LDAGQNPSRIAQLFDGAALVNKERWHRPLSGTEFWHGQTPPSKALTTSVLSISAQPKLISDSCFMHHEIQDKKQGTGGYYQMLAQSGFSAFPDMFHRLTGASFVDCIYVPTSRRAFSSPPAEDT
jgi:hypothetical protein